MAKKKIRNIQPSDSQTGRLKPVRIDLGPTKTIKKDKWKRQRLKTGKQSAFLGKSEVIEDAQGVKYQKNSITTGDGGGSFDWNTAKNHRRKVFDQAGKGDAPRNMGKKFHENYKTIDWGSKKEKTKQGVPVPKKTIKVYK